MKCALLAAAPLAAALLLVGCASKQEMIAADNNACKSMGLKFGTPEFAQCRMVQDARRDIERANAMQQYSEGLDMIAKGLSNRPASVNVYHY
jgi:hypothetical protein